MYKYTNTSYEGLHLTPGKIPTDALMGILQANKHQQGSIL